jgi:dTDP-4-amino-4,6-dideoxygalactose transaminase
MHDGREMANAKIYENCLVRLPLWVEISNKQISKVIQTIKDFYF